MIRQFLLVALGGAAGSVLRFAAQRIIPAQSFPYNTFAVNISGCFLIGVLWALLLRGALQSDGRLLLMVGFCGGFTTFSAFTLEGMLMLQSGKWFNFLLYMLFSTVFGLLATLLGFKLFH